MIGDPVTGHVLAEQDIPLSEARRIARWIDETGYMTAFYFMDHNGNTRVFRNCVGRSSEEEELLHHLFGVAAVDCERFAPLLDATDAVVLRSRSFLSITRTTAKLTCGLNIKVVLCRH